MRQSKKIDYNAAPVGDGAVLIRLLCSPLYYDKETNIVSAEAFNLRMMGKKKAQEEQFASLGHKEFLIADNMYDDFIQLGYHVWDDKEGEDNEYVAYGTLLCQDAIKVKPDCIEIHHLAKGKKGHVGLFYAKNEDEYYKGPLPTNQVEVLEMLNDLSNLIANSVTLAPDRKHV